MPRAAQAMKFFIPRTKHSEVEAVYAEMKRSLFDQLRMPIVDRRIFKLSYTNSKRDWHVQVGEPGQREPQYEVMAIFESTVFIVLNQTSAGSAGPIVLVDKAEVTGVEDFTS
jgi:hypothetical protein